MMKRGFLLFSILSLALLAAPAWVVPNCGWASDPGNCSVWCVGNGHGTCASVMPNPCANDCRYTWVCADGTTYNGNCSGCGTQCGGGGGGGGGGCFFAGTMITLADGSQKPIEEIQAGDKVLSLDEVTGELKIDRVSVVHAPDFAERYLVVNGHLRLTPTHPVLSGGEWVEIGQLSVGDTLTAEDGSAVAIESIKVVGAQ